ncbi:hypothetical protein SB521682_4637 [Shigella boydii 5216-82]|nr:hypothetical protein SB521682_4637 [Shigella boydii 5216-82]
MPFYFRKECPLNSGYLKVKKVCICREQDFVSCSRFLSSYYWIAKVRSSSGAV